MDWEWDGDDPTRQKAIIIQRGRSYRNGNQALWDFAWKSLSVGVFFAFRAKNTPTDTTHHGDSHRTGNDQINTIPKEFALKPTSHFRRPSLAGLFLIFLSLGIQSFGGGSSTFFLIHQTCIERGWCDEEEFVRTWALVQISPGINLLKLTMIIGHQLQGWPGLFCAAAGLMLPSGAVTALMTAGFALVRDQPVIQAVMKGILPATIGLSLAMIIQMGQPLLTRAYQEGPARMGASVFVLAGAGMLLAVWNVSPVLVLVIAGGLTAGLLSVVPVKPARPVQ